MLAKKLLFMGCIASLALVPLEAAANVLVVRSSGPSAGAYPAGRSLPDAARVTLRQGDVLVVLGVDSSRTLRGPGTFSLAGATRASASLAMAAGARRGRFSALRTAGIVPRSPTIWHVDVSQSGKFCLSDTSNVMLWRPDAVEAVTLTVAKAGGAEQSVQWPAGQATLAWPQGLPIAAGSEYQVLWSGNDDPTRLTFTTLPSVPGDLTAVAQALIGQECRNQLDALIETVPADSPAPES